MLNAKPSQILGGVGYIGYFERLRSIDSISNELGRKLKTKCRVWRFGKTNIKKIAIVTGYGVGELSVAVKKGIDLFITGEISHGTYNRAKDMKISLIEAGHYKTETVGVKEIGKLLEKKFGLKTFFINLPTSM
jgi:putative NIF3 family GTP cyclohydrolase 1 type 2